MGKTTKKKQSMVATRGDAEKAIANREGLIIKRAGRISAMILRAPEVPKFKPSDPDASQVEKEADVAEQAETWAEKNGWSPRDVRVALDSSLPKSHAPFYLSHAASVLETASKLATAGRTAANVAIQIVMGQNSRQYDVVDVSATQIEDKK